MPRRIAGRLLSSPASLPRRLLATVVVLSMAATLPARAAELSHSPLRPLPQPVQRPLESGRGYFVDATRGSDEAQGSEQAPFRTLARGLEALRPGDTLYLRGGVYYERPAISLVGREDAPITVRSYPGELAIIDGSLREFFEEPQACWEPVAGSTIGEYRSRTPYPNLRHVLGSFGDSMIGLQTYYHAQDLRAVNEFALPAKSGGEDAEDIPPLYCGPGVWYDRETGYIYCRLAHTHLPEPIANYRGPTDPREVPLILTPMRATTLLLDGAEHVHLKDLVIRGGGYTTVGLDHARHIVMDNVVIYCGTYGLRAARTGPLKLYRCALYGNVAPWTFRSDGSKRDYPGRPYRNISRLNTHALIEIEAGQESSVYATPLNDDWEFAYCDFTDAHDGLYLGCINARVHHCLIDGLQDDGIYLSPMYHRYRLLPSDPEIHIYQNYFGACLTAIAFGGPHEQTRDTVFIYRNVFDLRGTVQTGRPREAGAPPGISHGQVIGDHGSPPWSSMNIYHNTIVAATPARTADMGLYQAVRDGYRRRVFNNLVVHLARLPAFPVLPAEADVAGDGNLYYCPSAQASIDQVFARFRKSPAFVASRARYTPGVETSAVVADPQLVHLPSKPGEPANYALRPGSPAIDAGVPLPEDWPDPLAGVDQGKPDIGALPQGARMLRAGRASAPAIDKP